jgi:hypothetical protein
MTVTSTTRTRRADGTWGGWTTTVTEPVAPVASPVTYSLRTTRSTAPAVDPDSVGFDELDGAHDDDAYSTDPIDY